MQVPEKVHTSADQATYTHHWWWPKTSYHPTFQTNQTNQLQFTTGSTATSTTNWKATRLSTPSSDSQDPTSPRPEQYAHQPPPIHRTPPPFTTNSSVLASQGWKKPALALRRLQDYNIKDSSNNDTPRNTILDTTTLRQSSDTYKWHYFSSFLLLFHNDTYDFIIKLLVFTVCQTQAWGILKT